MDFVSLQHKSESKVHVFGGLPPPPSGRLQGLITLLTVFALRLLVSFVSHSPRSWDFPLRSFTCHAGYCDVTVPVNPPAVSTHIEPEYKYSGGDAKCGSWVFDPWQQAPVLASA
jgi:hypothetical protein